MDLQVHALRNAAIAIWDRYEWFGHTLIGQYSFVIGSPFSYLLALTPLDANGHLQVWWVHLWLVSVHCIAALFAYWLFRDLDCSGAAAAIGALLYATSSGIGNTGWPQFLVSAIWGPLVFLFLFRTLRGRTPLKSAAWAGVTLGMIWLGGHHSPAIYMTLASFGTGLTFFILRPTVRFQLARRLALMFVVFVATASVQSLPVFEAGRLSLRWISSGATGWKDKVPFTEHGLFSLSIPDTLHLFVPGGTGLYWDPFIGVVGLSLAAIAILSIFRRSEVRIFTVLGLSAFLFALGPSDVFYGLFYTLVPLIEKAREPLVALSIFDIAIAALAAFGLDQLLTKAADLVLPRVAKVLAGFALLTFALFLLAAFLQPTVTSHIAQGDPRVGMIALIALGAAALLIAWKNQMISRSAVVILLGASMMIEQGVESDWNYSTKDTFLKPLFSTQDVADFLRARPAPVRVETSSDVGFNFGNWYRIDAPEGYSNGLPADIYRLGWSPDRLSNMFGQNYTISRASNRTGQQDLFTGKSGLKVFSNPAAFPRVWTVHDIHTAPDEDRAATLVRDGPLDLRSTAVLTTKIPPLDHCTGDQVTDFREDLSSVTIDVTMNCKGLVILSDSFYPGWRAHLDGNSSQLLKVNTVIRGVVAPAGHHQITMHYRPLSVYLGLALTLAGFATALILQLRQEPIHVTPIVVEVR